MLSPSICSDAPPEIMLSELDSSELAESAFPELSELGLSELDESELIEPVACSDVYGMS